LNVAFYRTNVNFVEHIALSRKVATDPTFPRGAGRSGGDLTGRREWTSACRRYVFINHHALRQTMADPAAGWAAASQGRAFFAYDINALIDLRNAVIVDVEATTGIRHVA
jgi:hypothetical protein